MGHEREMSGDHGDVETGRGFGKTHAIIPQKHYRRMSRRGAGLGAMREGGEERSVTRTVNEQRHRPLLVGGPMSLSKWPHKA